MSPVTCFTPTVYVKDCLASHICQMAFSLKTEGKDFFPLRIRRTSSMKYNLRLQETLIVTLYNPQWMNTNLFDI